MNEQIKNKYKKALTLMLTAARQVVAIEDKLLKEEDKKPKQKPKGGSNE